MKWRQKYHVTSAVQNILSFPYPSGRDTAHHNRAGIGPMLVASDRRRPGTGPPRQVHRIRALVCVYYTTIQIYKYKIIQNNIQMMMRQWQSIWYDSPQQIRQVTLSSPHSRNDNLVCRMSTLCWNVVCIRFWRFGYPILWRVSANATCSIPGKRAT